MHLISPPENDSFRKDLCFSPDVYLFFPREISEMRGPTGLKFCTMVSTRLNFIMLVQNFGGHTPKKFQGRKTCKIWFDFGRLRSSVVNISETDEDIQNQIVIPCMAMSSCVRRNKYGEVWSSDLGDLHALENHQVLLAHPPPGTEASLTTFFKGGSKIGLKCNKLALITSELGGVARRNFGT